MMARNNKLLGVIKQSSVVLGFIIVLFCSLFLQSSTTHSSQVFFYYLDQNSSLSYIGLWPAAKQGSHKALNALVKHADTNQDLYWLKKAATLNNLNAQLTLMNLTTGAEQQYWQREAANNGHGPSQFAISLIEKSNKQRVKYLEQAAHNEHIPAILALSDYYYARNDANNALRWLGKASQHDHTYIFRLAKMLWQQGKYEEATNAFQRASLEDYVAGAYLEAINNNARKSLSTLSRASLVLKEQCSQVLQFVATSLDSAVQATIFKKHFEQDNRLESLPICIKPIVWLAKNELNCKLLGNRNVCDLTSLAALSFNPGFTHLVFFLNKGKGYVQNGIMYLDQADTYSVFVHELAHFVGFVDEYAVNATLAKQFCTSNKAPNLMVSESTNFEEDETFRMWQKYNQQSISYEGKEVSNEVTSPKDTEQRENYVDIGESLTCSALGMKSYKPSKKLTFMQYHDTRLIPPMYLLMWQDLLKDHHQSIAVSEAFKRQARLNENVEAQAHWAQF